MSQRIGRSSGIARALEFGLSSIERARDAGTAQTRLYGALTLLVV